MNIFITLLLLFHNLVSVNNNNIFFTIYLYQYQYIIILGLKIENSIVFLVLELFILFVYRKKLVISFLLGAFDRVLMRPALKSKILVPKIKKI